MFRKSGANMMDEVARAAELLESGGFILVYDEDDREEEVDLVMLAEKATPRHVYTLRRDAGGLICVALHPKIWKRWGLPFLHDILGFSSRKYDVLSGLNPNDIPYDSRSSFSVTVNHRKTYTGVTDNDRALTIREIGRIGRETMERPEQDWKSVLGKAFRSPGHVHLLLAAEGLLRERRGHTELTVAFAEAAGLPPVMVLCEMLDGETGGALSFSDARKYAEKHGFPIFRGEDIAQVWERRHEG
ncbi:MAG: 3,4-dihydroxy-2-butanone-4-phosphate synthase [Candidatus Jordarchaeales archaeon]